MYLRTIVSMLAIALSLALAPLTVMAFETYEIVIQFNTETISTEPSVRPDGLTFTSVQKGILNLPLDNVVAFQPMHNRGNAGFSFDGPWILTFMSENTEEETIAILQAHPDIQDVHPYLVKDPTQGEGAFSVFPDVSQSEFCTHQSYLHRRYQGESLLDGDICGATSPYSYDTDMDLPQAWGITRGDTSIVVAIIDSGVDFIHPDMGGPGPGVTVADSLLYYNQGNIWRNWDELPGDANGDGCPGICGVDDDGDGFIDEDSMGREPGNTAEWDVCVGTATSYSTYQIIDENANWVPGELVGRYVFGTLAINNVYERIINNTETTITTDDSLFLVGVVEGGGDGWAELAATVNDSTYKVCNLFDDDGDGWQDDLGYLADTVNDDDENGYPDDIRGWDFYEEMSLNRYNCQKCANEDYTVPDSDPRSLWDHGTAVASMVAASGDFGGMVGVAPNVRIMPLRVGAQYDCGEDCGDPILETFTNTEAAVKYAIDNGANILATAWGTILYSANLRELIEEAIVNRGLVATFPAGNEYNELARQWSLIEGGITVAGLAPNDQMWVDSNHGTWVDISARSTGLFPAVWGVKWLPPELWHTYPQYQWSGTSLASPIVAGVAALVKSAYPNWTSGEVVSKIIASADDEIYDVNPTLRGGPHPLDSSAASLRWTPRA